MTIEERAREIAEFSGKCNFADPANCPQCIHQITEALRTVRDEALEEAARIADVRADYTVPGWSVWDNAAGKAKGEGIAKAIRSLKTEVSRERETG